MEQETPNVSTLTKVYYATDKKGTDKKQVMFTEEIPPLEEAPEQITAQVLDLEYELAQPGIRKASSIELPVLYTHKQHKELSALDKNKDYYWFFELPQSTVPESGKSLVRYLKGKMRLTMDTISVGEFLKDKLTIYKNSAVEESEGFPTV